MIRSTLILASILLMATTVAAHEEAWVLQTGVTPETLVARGALLSATDSLAWPDGRSADITYWLSTDDIVFRCADLRDESAAAPSCWQQIISVSAADHSGQQIVRRISTRRRPPLYSYQQPYYPNPRVWVGVHR